MRIKTRTQDMPPRESVLQNNKQIQKENIVPLLNRKGELVTRDAAMTEVLKTFLASVFTCTVGPGLGTKNPG